MTTPAVSVLMAVYNGASFLKESIQSILSQSYKDLELLIIDDGSDDGSLEIINSFTDKRIRVLQNQLNKGLIFTRNRGINEARGKYLAILDCDDIAFPERISKQVDFLAKHSEIKLCGGQAITIDKNGVETGNFLKVPTNKRLLNVQLLFHNVFINSTIMMELEAVKQVGGYSSNYSFCEDYALSLAVAERFKVANLESTLIKYRVHEESTSQLKSTAMKENERRIIASIHEKLKIESDDELIEIHLSLLNPNGSDLSLNEYKRLFVSILAGNPDIKLYKKDLLKEFIFLKWFELIKEKRARNPLNLYFDKELFYLPAATLKQLRKIAKQNFSFF